MAHTTKIDGTSYSITGGRAKVDGAVYSIKKGQTKVDGTGYSISFGLPTFTIQFPDAEANGAPDFVYEFEEGMTWEDFQLSDYLMKYYIPTSSFRWCGSTAIGSNAVNFILFKDVGALNGNFSKDDTGAVTFEGTYDPSNDLMFSFATFKNGSGQVVNSTDKIIAGAVYTFTT